MSNNKITYCDDTLIKSQVIYGLCKTEKALKKELKRLKVKSKCDFLLYGSNATTHFFENNGKFVAIVCIDNEHLTKIESYGLLIHEAVHIWQKNKESMGEDSPSEEFEAYSIQCIAQRLIEAYQ